MNDNRKKRIRYLCLQSTQQGQASYAHVREIIKGLIRRGWTVDLFEPTYTATKLPPALITRLLAMCSAQIRLFARGDAPSLLYVRAHAVAFPSALLAKMMRVPVVQEVNGPYEDLMIAWPWTKRFAGIFVWLARIQLKWAKAVITVTPGLRDWVIQETENSSVYVVPNGADDQLFRPDATCSCQPQQPYVLFFGALAAWQGIDNMIMATRRPEWPRDVSLVIVGDGIQKRRVDAAAREDSRIIALGTIPYREVPGIVANSLTSICPATTGVRTRTGLSPIKLYETLACGVPAIVTDFAGQADIIRQHECGIVVPPDDPGELARAVAYLHENPDARAAMGKNGRKAIEDYHSWDKRADATQIVIEQALLLHQH